MCGVDSGHAAERKRTNCCAEAPTPASGRAESKSICGRPLPACDSLSWNSNSFEPFLPFPLPSSSTLFHLQPSLCHHSITPSRPFDHHCLSVAESKRLASPCPCRREPDPSSPTPNLFVPSLSPSQRWFHLNLFCSIASCRTNMSEPTARSSAPRGRGSGRGGRGGYSSRGGRPRHANGDKTDVTPVVEQEDEGGIGQLLKKHGSSVSTIRELFSDWTNEDAVFALEEFGDLNTTINRISDGKSSGSFPACA